MTRHRSDGTHQYVASGEAADWAGRVPCRRCGIPDWATRPVNEHHKNYVPPETDDSRILGERGSDAA